MVISFEPNSVFESEGQCITCGDISVIKGEREYYVNLCPSLGDEKGETPNSGYIGGRVKEMGVFKWIEQLLLCKVIYIYIYILFISREYDTMPNHNRWYQSSRTILLHTRYHAESHIIAFQS